jgi:hypothetical protein
VAQQLVVGALCCSFLVCAAAEVILPVGLFVSLLQTAYADHLALLSALCHALHDVSSADLSLAQNLPTPDLQVHTRPFVCMGFSSIVVHKYTSRGSEDILFVGGHVRVIGGTCETARCALCALFC